MTSYALYVYLIKNECCLLLKVFSVLGYFAYFIPKIQRNEKTFKCLYE